MNRGASRSERANVRDGDTLGPAGRGGKDIGFAVGIVLILCLFFLPVPATMIDFGLALSIAVSVLILMVGLWIQKPLEFSAFPTVLLVATILRLALNISTTRLILSRGAEGPTSAGYIIGGFARLVMGGDFLIGIIVFLILVTINFLVITKGATRIAEVGARFTLDAIPGKQMAIDADLSAGLIDEKIAQGRRRELEEESAFFGSMDGASKFVRGDAIAGLIILAVNIFRGIVTGVTRHGLSLSAAADIFTKLSVGDGLVTQIPALIISLAAGLLVAKGGTRGSADKAVIDQLSGYPNALFLAALLMATLGVVPGLPFLPFATLGGLMAFVGVAIALAAHWPSSGASRHLLPRAGEGKPPLPHRASKDARLQTGYAGEGWGEGDPPGESHGIQSPLRRHPRGPERRRPRQGRGVRASGERSRRRPRERPLAPRRIGGRARQGHARQGRIRGDAHQFLHR